MNIDLSIEKFYQPLSLQDCPQNQKELQHFSSPKYPRILGVRGSKKPVECAGVARVVLWLASTPPGSDEHHRVLQDFCLLKALGSIRAHRTICHISASPSVLLPAYVPRISDSCTWKVILAESVLHTAPQPDSQSKAS